MLRIRPGLKTDASSLARMISGFNVEEGSPGRIDAGGVAALCFAEQPIYRTIVADAGGDLVGYALIMRFFDTEPCVWCSYMQDLFVVPAKRSQGIGRQLIAAAARLALDQGHQALFWHVRARNDRGRAFYAAIGGVEQTPLPITLEGKALAAIASESLA